MLIADLLGWWYSRGWAWVASELFVKKTESIAGFFSIADLLRTLFAPFRQDAMNVSGAPIGVRLQAIGGNIISRVFGLIIRSTLIILGLVLMVLNFLVALVGTILWPLLPLTPIVGITLFFMGFGR